MRTQRKMHLGTSSEACVSAAAILTPELRDLSTLAAKHEDQLAPTAAQKHTSTTAVQEETSLECWRASCPVLDHNWLWTFFEKMKLAFWQILVPSPGASERRAGQWQALFNNYNGTKF